MSERSERARRAQREGSAIDRLLEEERRVLPRRPPASEVDDLLAAGALLVDIRPAHQRHRDGELPGALVVDRNVLEWRLDPTSPDRLVEAGDGERQVVVVCDAGYASSLAAAALQRLGLHRATDLDGGYQAWRRWQARDDGVTPGPPPAG